MKPEDLIETVDWERTCWANRFSNEPICGKPAKWQGDPSSAHEFTRQWRACDEHRVFTDVPIGETREYARKKRSEAKLR